MPSRSSASTIRFVFRTTFPFVLRTCFRVLFLFLGVLLLATRVVSDSVRCSRHAPAPYRPQEPQFLHHRTRLLACQLARGVSQLRHVSRCHPQADPSQRTPADFRRRKAQCTACRGPREADSCQACSYRTPGFPLFCTGLKHVLVQCCWRLCDLFLLVAQVCQRLPR